jgi:hypothetical protein
MTLALLDIDDKSWHSFVAAHPAAMVFHHPGWAGLIAACYGYRSCVVSAKNELGQIQAGIPLLEVPGLLGGRKWVSLPFSDYYRPLATDQASLEVLTDHLIELQKSGHLPSIEIKWPLPHRAEIDTATNFVIHSLSLTAVPEALFGKFRKGHRYNIKKAMNGALAIKRVSTKSDFKKYYRLHLHTRQRLGMPVQPLKFFDLLWENFLNTGLGFVLLAMLKDKPVAGAVFLTYKDTITYKYSASDSKYWSLYPNNLLLWEAIKTGSELGYKYFDFGNSEISNIGLRKFKNGFGATEEELAYSFVGAAPQNGKPGAAKKILNTVISHSPSFVCQWTGELLYRHYG